MEKVLLFTHGIDIDGYGCAVLAKLAFGNDVEVHYADNFELDEMFAHRVYGVSTKEILEGKVDKSQLIKNAQNALREYTKVYITDHCLSFPLCQFVDEDTETASKLLVLDHHTSRKAEQGQFDWVKIADKIDESTMACGTNMFYYHLISEGKIFPTHALARWARCTALCDTWTWKGSPCEEECVKLDVLGKALGREKYVEHYTQKFSKLLKTLKPFKFTPEEEKLIKEYQAAYAKKLDEYVSKIQIVEFDGLKAGFVHIKDLFKNDIAESVRHLPLGQKIDFLIMPVDDRESVSLRNINPNCDVSKIAQAHGGGGHFAAASFPKENLKGLKFDKNFGGN